MLTYNREEIFSYPTVCVNVLLRFEPTLLPREPGLWLWITCLRRRDLISNQEGAHLLEQGSKQQPHGIVGFFLCIWEVAKMEYLRYDKRNTKL